MPWSSPVPAKKKGDRTTPIPSGNQTGLIIPPVGINQVDPIAEFPDTDAVFMYNWVASRYGTRVRTGYQQYGVTVGTGGVKTVIPYAGTDSTRDRLFAIAADGIYDLTSPATAPAVKLAFPSQTTKSGHGIWTAFTTIGGFFTTYFDSQFGYYLYTESTDTWVRVLGSDVTGVNPNNLVFGCIYKAKIWTIQDGTSDAWYLPTGSVIGAATRFAFGNKFRHGGTLQALYTWTHDSATGIDEYLIAISSSGEVVVYNGDDPSDATNFRQVGSWFIGTVPIGRRIGGSFGGDLYLLSVYGLLPISKLIAGELSQTDSIELSRKISPAVQQNMALSFQTLGWEVKLNPSDNTLIVVAPQLSGFPFTQFVQSLNNQGWSIYQAMPIYTGEMYNGKFYFGGLDSNLYVQTGTLDNLSMDGSTGVQIQASMLTAFKDYEKPGFYHRGQIIRPVFLTSGQPTYSVEVRYDYNIQEVFATGGTTPPSGAVWDLGVWDVAVWTGDFIAVDQPQGALGVGRAMAVGLNISTGVATTLVRFDLTFDEAASISL